MLIRKTTPTNVDVTSSAENRTKSLYGDVGTSADRRRNTLVGVCRPAPAPAHVEEERKRDFEVQRRRASKSLGDYREVNDADSVTSYEKKSTNFRKNAKYVDPSSHSGNF